MSSTDDSFDNATTVGIIFFFLFGISLGTLTGYLIRVFSFPIPYPVVVFFEGIGVAFVFSSILKGSIDTISNSTVAPDLVLYVFLPVLLFGEIKNLNWHHVKGGFWQGLLLAGPGALIAAVLTASIFSAIYNSYGDWESTSIYLFWVLGSLLCATDPVSIVTLLKTFGASSKLTIVVIGESLMNDGSAMVLFFFFAGVCKNGSMYSSQQVFVFIAEKLIVSPLLGIIVGLISVYIMRRLYEDWNLTDMSIQIIISLLCGYSSFFMAEYGLGNAYGGQVDGSGVLAVCGAGAVFSWICSPKILQNHTMVEVWENLEWVCNTLIFLLGGILAGASTPSSSQWGYLFALFFMVQFIRLFMVLLLHPIVSRIGLKCTLKDSLFMSFCGVRGALALALALQFKAALQSGKVQHCISSANDYLKCDAEAKEFYFLVSGIVALTLLVNGSLGEFVLRWLQLVEDPNKPPSPEMKTVLRNVKRAIRRQVREEVESMDMELGRYDAEEVSRLCKLMRSSIESRDGGDDYEPSKRHESSSIKPDLLAYVRNTFLEAVRAHYVESIHNGKIGTQAFTAQLLLYTVDKAVDCINDEMDPERLGELGDLSCLERNLQPAKWVERMAAGLDDLFARCGLHPGYIPYLESLNERRALFALTNFIDAHKAAQSKLHIFLGAPEKDVGMWLPEETNVMAASVRSVERAKQLLGSIDSKHITDFYNLRTARMVLIRQKDLVSTMLTEGALSKKWAHAMLATIEDDEVRNDIERQSVSRSMLRDSTRRKIDEDRELRQSVASRDSQFERQSLSGRPSLRQSLMQDRHSQVGINSDQLTLPGIAQGAGEYNDAFAESLRPSFTHRPSYVVSTAGRGGAKENDGKLTMNQL